MSGHSKWSKIKHKKKKQDKKKGKKFAKLTRAITTAAREGGGDPEFNPRLRTAISNAKAEDMPKENIQKAIKRGTGELPGVSYERAVYEGYGPAGTAIMVETLTDNKNRTVSELRNIFSDHDGNLGESGCVSWIFEKRGLITIEKDNHSKDVIMDIALEAGAVDLDEDEDVYQIITNFEELEDVRSAYEEESIQSKKAKPYAVPKSTVEVEGREAEKLFALIDALEDHDDVQLVFSNFEIDDEVLEEISTG